MKKINLVLIVIYFIIAIYFAIFNWDVFILQLNVSLGFAILNIPLIVVIFLLSLIFLIFQWAVAIVSDLSKEKILTNKDEEINIAKATFYDSNENRLQKISDSIEQLFIRIDGLSRQIIPPTEKIEKPVKDNNDLPENSKNE